MPRPRRLFPPEYKAEVVELTRTTGKTAGQVARELDLTETAVREWVKRADLDAGRRTDGLTTAERGENQSPTSRPKITSELGSYGWRPIRVRRHP